MPDRCVVYGCSNVNDPENGISLHRIPFFNDNRSEALARRKKWVDFVKSKRAKWEPTASSHVCSCHFAKEDFSEQFLFPGVKRRRELKKDAVGVVPVPRFQKNAWEEEELSSRTRRQILKEAFASHKAKESSCQSADNKEVCCEDSEEMQATRNDVDIACSSSSPPTASNVENDQEPVTKDFAVQTRGCIGCASLKEELRQLGNKLIMLTEKNDALMRKPATTSTSIQCDRIYEEQLFTYEKEGEPPVETSNAEVEKNVSLEPDEEIDQEDDLEVTEEEPEYDNTYDANYKPDTDTDTGGETETDNEDDNIIKGPRLHDDNLRTTPKHIVFLSKLLLLFQFCHTCRADNPLVETRQIGTMAVVTTWCQNPTCPKKENVWHSQPYMPGTKTPAGNFLLCFAILLAGGSASKIFQIFQHMGLACISLSTFFYHQRVRLFPAIYIHWKKYQEEMIKKLKALKEPLTISGDGRHDSMGHSAKFGAYTIFCCSLPLIIHFALVQRNEVGSSTALEYAGFQRAMTFLFGCGLAIGTFISDRHVSIAKHMREKLSNITHFFDLWHLKKQVRKVLTKISKQSGCESLTEWIRPCENHLYWSATTTMCGTGRIIWAKFKSFLSHIINKHDNLDDPLFNRCGHGSNIQHRKWFLPNSVVYEKVVAALTETRLVKGIMQASPIAQTSCLEGFHSVLNHFCPKMISFSYVGMLCRHILAAMHFNYNLVRDTKIKVDGSSQVKVIYPKFKNGEASVRDVRIQPRFDYVEDIYQTFIEAAKTGTSLKEANKELKEMTPLPMNTMLEKEPREEALEKRKKRKEMTVKNVPPTTPLAKVLEHESTSSKKRKRESVSSGTTSKRKKPSAESTPKMCRTCKRPVKGHKRGECPKNQAS